MKPSRKNLRAKALEVLEWPRLLEKLAERASSPRGKEACRSLHMATTVEGAQRSMDETAELAALLEEGGSVPLGRFEDIEGIIKQCEKGASIQTEELHDIATMLELARLARGFFKNFREQTPFLWERAQSIDELVELKNTIGQVIDDTGGVKENATPELRRKLQSLRDQRATVVSRMEDFMRRDDIGEYLQDIYYTQRANRYVLPVKADFRYKIEGIVHDSSQSGQTLFIEPRQFIDANNRLKMAELEVEQEIEKILGKLVGMVSVSADILRIDLEILTELDVIYARAKLARDLDANAPRINDNGEISLKAVRHPHLVLQPSDVVPNDVEMGRDMHAMLISGPNTGGKTVMLKTVGLCALMVRTGMLIPADEGSEMALFTDILADIGDEQDIEEHLSTFSGHIFNIIGILDAARSGSLVLLDELVTSTDPAEGSALAESILHQLVERDAKVVATTHYTQLKAYAEAHPGFENAGVEFDTVSLTPTYRFIQGVPGRSSAFEIASRLGMEPDVIKRAKNLIDSSDERVEELLTALDKQREELNARQKELQLSIRSIENLKREQLAARKKLRDMEHDFRRNVRTRLNDEIDNARDRIREVLTELDRVRTVKAVSKARESIGDVEKSYSAIIPDDGDPVDPKSLEVGDPVIVSHLGVRGVLLEEVGDKNKVKVLIGRVPMVVEADSLRSDPESTVGVIQKGETDWAAVNRKKDQIEKIGAGESSASHTLDIRGYRTDDALDEVDKFLDRAAISGIAEVEIIHGHGTGTLKKFVRDHLNKSGYVSSWKPAELQLGGDGVTRATLKPDKQ